MHSSNRLIYDIPKQDDFERFYEIYSDPQTHLFNPKGPLTHEDCKTAFDAFIKHWSVHNFGSWTVRLKESGNIIGFGGLSNRLYGDEMRLNLGYRFDKDAWGNGFATELSIYTIEYAFYVMNRNKLFAIVRPAHSASIKVLEKCNMKLLETLNDFPGQEHSLVYIIEKSINHNQGEARFPFCGETSY